MKKSGLIFSFLLVFIISGKAQMIAPEAKKVQGYMPDNAVIAHRGTIYWAPELTEPAFRWARNTGADYLELDVQRSKDGVLIIMHDKTFKRTTDVNMKYPGRENDPVSSFTFAEIMNLDAGSSFNSQNPDRSRPGYSGQQVLVFEDVFRIAEGKRIRRNPDGSRVVKSGADGQYRFEYEADPADNGNRPGVYIEFKVPEEYPGIEEQVYNELARMGWNPLELGNPESKVPFRKNGKVNVGKTNGRILVQSFSRQGMKNIQRVFGGKVLASFLIGNPKSNDFAHPEVLDGIVLFALETGVQFIGTNLGETNEGLTPLFAQKIHAAGLKANVYSINDTEQMVKYFGRGKGKKAMPLADGMITNRAELTIDFYHEQKVRKESTKKKPEEILKNLGY